MSRSYSYSPVHRALEVLSIGGLALLVGFIAYEITLGVRTIGPYGGYWAILAMGAIAYVAADFVSGFVHFVGDTFGTPETPVFGASFIKPFREHHVDPRGMTRHDFIETNGNNCMVCIPPALFIYGVLPVREELWSWTFALFMSWLFLWVFMTNQFHKWSHLEDPPGWIVRLQSWRLILSPDHHDIHHTPPFDTYYCITTGWLNPLLHRVRFFPRLEAVIRWVTRQPKPLPELPSAKAS